jgi:hypothetical protein
LISQLINEIARQGRPEFENVPVTSKSMANRYRPGNRHRPGYVAPSRKALKSCRLELRPDTLTAWKEAAARAGMSQRQAAEYVFRAFAREMGIDIAPHPGPTEPSEPKPLTRLIVPGLDC